MFPQLARQNFCKEMEKFMFPMQENPLVVLLNDQIPDQIQGSSLRTFRTIFTCCRSNFRLRLADLTFRDCRSARPSLRSLRPLSGALAGHDVLNRALRQLSGMHQVNCFSGQFTIKQPSLEGGQSAARHPMLLLLQSTSQLKTAQTVIMHDAENNR